MRNCSKSYNDETFGSLIEWVTSKKDKYSYIFEHFGCSDRKFKDYCC